MKVSSRPTNGFGTCGILFLPVRPTQRCSVATSVKVLHPAATDPLTLLEYEPGATWPSTDRADNGRQKRQLFAKQR